MQGYLSATPDAALILSVSNLTDRHVSVERDSSCGIHTTCILQKVPHLEKTER